MNIVYIYKKKSSGTIYCPKEMLFVEERKPELNTQSDLIKAKLLNLVPDYYPLHSTF